MTEALDIVRALLDAAIIDEDMQRAGPLISDTIWIHGTGPFSVQGKDNLLAMFELFASWVDPKARKQTVPVQSLIKVTHIFGSGDWAAVRIESSIGASAVRRRWPPDLPFPPTLPGFMMDESPQSELIALIHVSDQRIDQIWMLSNHPTGLDAPGRK